MRVETLIVGLIIVTSLLLLAVKELAMTNGTGFANRLSKYLHVPIIVMVIMFIALLAFGIMEIQAEIPG